MTTDLLDGVKIRLGITGSYQDALISAYIDDVKAFLLSAGVSTPVIENAEKSIGVIARGVADLWNYGAGNGHFSEVFLQRLIQIKYLDKYSTEGEDNLLLKELSNEEIDDRTHCLED